MRSMVDSVEKPRSSARRAQSTIMVPAGSSVFGSPMPISITPTLATEVRDARCHQALHGDRVVLIADGDVRRLLAAPVAERAEAQRVPGRLLPGRARARRSAADPVPGGARRAGPQPRRRRYRVDRLRPARSEEHTSELQSQSNLVCRLLLEKKKMHK